MPWDPSHSSHHRVAGLADTGVMRRVSEVCADFVQKSLHMGYPVCIGLIPPQQGKARKPQSQRRFMEPGNGHRGSLWGVVGLGYRGST